MQINSLINLWLKNSLMDFLILIDKNCTIEIKHIMEMHNWQMKKGV